MIAQCIQHIPIDGVQFPLAIGLSNLLGAGPIDFQLSCENILEAAKRGNLTAVLLYRRWNEALSSICKFNSSGLNEKIDLLPTELKNMNIGNLYFKLLERLETAHSDNYLSLLLRWTEQLLWTVQIYRVICEIGDAELAQAQHQIELGRLLISCDAVQYRPIRNDRIEDLLRIKIEFLYSRTQLSTDTMTETDWELISHVLVAAMLFGDEHLRHLHAICKTIRKFGLSFCHHLAPMVAEEFSINQEISPMALAARIGNANAIRILHYYCRGTPDGPEINSFRSIDETIPLHFLYAF